ncbi:uncharacterized protein LOC144133643 [Amblyomma americanum]
MEYSAELLINAVREHRFLYDKYSRDFKNRSKKDFAWEEIGQLFGLTRTQVEQKFKNLRDIYMRKKQEIKNKQKSGAGAADIPTIKWPHFESMMALMEPSPQPALLLCSTEDDISFKLSADEAGERLVTNRSLFRHNSRCMPHGVGLPRQHGNRHDKRTDDCSTQAVEGLPEALPQASGCDVEGETWEQECCPDVYEQEAAQLPPAKRPRMSQKQTAENPGNAGDENILQACVSHLSTIREQRERQQKDDIALFCMLLDSRLRRLPHQVAEDFMHNIEMMTYDVLLQARTEV